MVAIADSLAWQLVSRNNSFMKKVSNSESRSDEPRNYAMRL